MIKQSPGRKRATKTQLDTLAKITPNDIERAKRNWRDDAPGPHKRRLDAKKKKVNE